MSESIKYQINYLSCGIKTLIQKDHFFPDVEDSNQVKTVL